MTAAAGESERKSEHEERGEVLRAIFVGRVHAAQYSIPASCRVPSVVCSRSPPGASRTGRRSASSSTACPRDFRSTWKRCRRTSTAAARASRRSRPNEARPTPPCCSPACSRAARPARRSRSSRWNQDAKSKDYDALKDVFRPGHADFTYAQKYGHRDHRGSRPRLGPRDARPRRRRRDRQAIAGDPRGLDRRRHRAGGRRDRVERRDWAIAESNADPLPRPGGRRAHDRAHRGRPRRARLGRRRGRGGRPRLPGRLGRSHDGEARRRDRRAR